MGLVSCVVEEVDETDDIFLRGDSERGRLT